MVHILRTLIVDIDGEEYEYDFYSNGEIYEVNWQGDKELIPDLQARLRQLKKSQI